MVEGIYSRLPSDHAALLKTQNAGLCSFTVRNSREDE